MSSFLTVGFLFTPFTVLTIGGLPAGGGGVLL